jgi:hypothetical protein
MLAFAMLNDAVRLPGHLPDFKDAVAFRAVPT